MRPLKLHTTTGEGGTTVVVEGAIDENASFAAIESLSGQVVIDLSRVEGFNSCGVRTWIIFLRSLERACVRLRGCPPRVVHHLNTIYNFRGRAVVESIQAPYLCARCGADELIQLELGSGRPDTAGSPPAGRPCPRCGGELRFDEDPERYFHFLAYR